MRRQRYVNEVNEVSTHVMISKRSRSCNCFTTIVCIINNDVDRAALLQCSTLNSWIGKRTIMYGVKLILKLSGESNDGGFTGYELPAKPENALTAEGVSVAQLAEKNRYVLGLVPIPLEGKNVVYWTQDDKYVVGGDSDGFTDVTVKAWRPCTLKFTWTILGRWPMVEAMIYDLLCSRRWIGSILIFKIVY